MIDALPGARKLPRRAPANVPHAFVPVLIAAFCASVFVTPVRAQPSIGLYRDTSGSNCSLSDTPGIFSAYVIVRPDVDGFTEVRFSAPIPSCFTGTYLADQAAPGTVVSGNSQTGVAVGVSYCAGTPTHVLTIQYYGYGTTPACCPYPILPDPNLSDITLVDCGGSTKTLANTPSVINPDASCPCRVNSPPFPPANPGPFDGAIDVSRYTSLTWSAEDPDNNIASYDVYFGTASTPPLVGTETETRYTPAPSPLDVTTTYYWRVVVRDSAGAETSGPTWSFTTQADTPPDVPGTPNPADGAIYVPLDATLSWTQGDADNDALVSDVYFGTSPSPPLVSSGQTPTTYSPGPLTYDTTYYWRIVSRDVVGVETSGPVWSFTARPENFPPTVPGNPSPLDGAQDVVLTTALQWASADPEGGSLTYDLYFGDTTTPPLLVSDLGSNTYSPAGLQLDGQYYWKIVARDSAGAETSGPEWSFKTRLSNYPPAPPSNPSPADGATASIFAVLTWADSDPDGQSLTYDVYFGTAADPPLVATNVAQSSFAPDTLALSTQYHWKIIARDPVGAETNGPIWSFMTNYDARPNTPLNPSPANGATNQRTDVSLSWQCSDPDGEPLTYDLFLGTDNPPGHWDSGLTQTTYHPETLSPSKVYYWQIVATDPVGRQSFSSIWNFSTVANTSPTAPAQPVPPDGGIGPPSPVLSWVSGDPDGQLLWYRVFFGTDSLPPMVEDWSDKPRYSPGALQVGTTYFWRVVVWDLVATVPGPLWSFTASVPGDVDQDGTVTPSDAACALQVYLWDGAPPFGCGGALGALAADVGGNGVVTPRDAHCIAVNATGGTCDYGGEVTASPTSAVVSVGRVRVQNDTLSVRLRVTGKGLQSFGLTVHSSPKLHFVDARRTTATGGFDAFDSHVRVPGVVAVGGYSLGPASAAPADFVELRYSPVGSAPGNLMVDEGVDDLAGAPSLTVSLDDAIAAAAVVTEVTLHPNVPNPFNPETHIAYDLPASGGAVRVRLRVVDIAGRVVRTLVDEEQSAGSHEVLWDGTDDRGNGVSSGIYFSVLDAGGRRITRKMVLLK